MPASVSTITYTVRQSERSKSESVSRKLCPALCNPMDCSPPGSSVHGILQARLLEWVVIPFSRGSSQLRIELSSPALQADSSPSKPPGKPQALPIWNFPKSMGSQRVRHDMTWHDNNMDWSGILACLGHSQFLTVVLSSLFHSLKRFWFGWYPNEWENGHPQETGQSNVSDWLYSYLLGSSSVLPLQTILFNLHSKPVT